MNVDHPLYGDEKKVARVTADHLSQGRSVFQLWMLAPDEWTHSIAVLDQIAPRHRARILSLGCGVGGMEFYWKQERRDLQFTMVNSSQVQIDMCLLGPGGICMDAQDYVLPPEAEPFDITIMAYMLGHVDAVHTIKRAMNATKPGGTVVVLDVFDGTEEFHNTIAYESPKSSDLAGLDMFKVANLQWMLPPYTQGLVEAGCEFIVGAKPAMWVGAGLYGTPEVEELPYPYPTAPKPA